MSQTSTEQRGWLPVELLAPNTNQPLLQDSFSSLLSQWGLSSNYSKEKTKAKSSLHPEHVVGYAPATGFEVWTLSFPDVEVLTICLVAIVYGHLGAWPVNYTHVCGWPSWWIIFGGTHNHVCGWPSFWIIFGGTNYTQVEDGLPGESVLVEQLHTCFWIAGESFLVEQLHTITHMFVDGWGIILGGTSPNTPAYAKELAPILLMHRKGKGSQTPHVVPIHKAQSENIKVFYYNFLNSETYWFAILTPICVLVTIK